MPPRQRVPEGPPAAPVVQRLRVRYAKRGRMRFSSTRDFQRALERAIRRADVPIAFTSGFHPHPRISYAGAAPTGTGSEAEYVELALMSQCDPVRVRAALDEALPDGLDLLEVVDASVPGGSLADGLEASVWQLVFDADDLDRVRTAVAAFLGRDEVIVSRMMKSGLRTFDARSAVVSAEVAQAPYADRAGDPSLATPGGGDAETPRFCAILQVVVRHSTPAVRPDDVVNAIREASGADLTPNLVHRLAQGPLRMDPVTVGDPLSPTADATGSR